MTYPNAAAGLRSIFQSKLVGLISIVLVIIPIVQIFAIAALLVAGFLALVGLCLLYTSVPRIEDIIVAEGYVDALCGQLLDAGHAAALGIDVYKRQYRFPAGHTSAARSGFGRKY